MFFFIAKQGQEKGKHGNVILPDGNCVDETH